MIFQEPALTINVLKTYEVAPGVLTEHGKVSKKTYTGRIV